MLIGKLFYDDYTFLKLLSFIQNVSLNKHTLKGVRKNAPRKNGPEKIVPPENYPPEISPPRKLPPPGKMPPRKIVSLDFFCF